VRRRRQPGSAFSPKGARIPSSKKEVSFARLADWVEGRLSKEEARAVEEQMATADSATFEDLAWLRAFFKISEETVLQPPPPEVRNKLISCFEAYRRASGQQDVVLRKREQWDPRRTIGKIGRRPRYERRMVELQCNECGQQFESRVLPVAIRASDKFEPRGWIIHPYGGARCPSCGSRQIGLQR
jgi:DNA-directed RNA polymerase subunit RPC12/RpoP